MLLIELEKNGSTAEVRKQARDRLLLFHHDHVACRNVLMRLKGNSGNVKQK